MAEGGLPPPPTTLGRQARPMPDPREAPPGGRASGLRLGAALFAGSTLLAAADAVAITLTVPLPTAGISLRLAHHLFDAAETLGVGALAGVVAGVFVCFVRVPRWAMTGVAVATLVALVRAAIGADLAQMAALTGGVTSRRRSTSCTWSSAASASRERTPSA